MASPILNPEIPYVGEVLGGLSPGKMLKVHGSTPPDAVRFAINYQLGPNINPRDDIAIHLSPRFQDGFITRNHIKSMSWGPEENSGPMWIQPGQEFEIIILCEPLQYKIAINGRHFTQFAHRLPYQKVTHLVIDGDVEIKSIHFESIGAPPSARVASAPDVPAPDFGAPGPGGLYPSLKPDAPPSGGYGHPGGYGPPPDAYGNSGGYNPPRAYGYQPGYAEPEEEEAFGGCLDKVGLAVGGLIAAGGVAAAMHAYNKKKHEHDEPEHEKSDSSKTESDGGGLNLGALGAALASSLAANALQGEMGRGQHQGYPAQESGGGGMLGSLLGALGGGGHHQPAQAPPPLPVDPMGGFGSILSGVLGGGGGHQQHSGGYQPTGGYGSQNQGSGDLLSALGSSLFSSALDGLSKHKSHDNHPSQPPPPAYHQSYGPRNDPPSPQPPPRAPTSPPASGGKLSAAEISKGLGLSDDEE
ncbi:spidroin-2 [Microplitis demolitor]|uniref:spidroin-2 n=1 Tax=Microplitis demolitor TaxID=69319 RepID=UPI0004CD9E4C|nr:spidroin-2 [Microplitis demolitor]